MTATFTNDPADQIDLAETRAKRLADIVDGYGVYEDGMPDSSVPGAAKVEYVTGPSAHPGRVVRIPRKHPRYVLVTEWGKGQYRLRLGDDLANVEQLAADALIDPEGGEQPICYFDLDVLAGTEPEIQEGDAVEYNECSYYVESVDSKDGSLTLNLDAEGSSPEADTWAYVDEVEVVKRAEPDGRMPVRYGLAKIVTTIVFNTIPSP